MASKTWQSVSFFETGVSAADWAWRIFSIVFIGSSTTITALVAKADPVLKGLGPVYWIGTAVLVTLLISISFFIFKAASLRQAQASYYNKLLPPKTLINPMSENFSDVVIYIEDLKLPDTLLHSRKVFKRCKFVGPANIQIIGGSFLHNNLVGCGDQIALPKDTTTTALITLQNCTIEECDFIRVGLFMDQYTGFVFSKTPGSSVKGLVIMP